MTAAATATRPIGRRLGRALRGRRGLRGGVIALVYIAVAFVLGAALPELDVGPSLSGARVFQMLITTGASVVTFIGIVYSLLFLVVQFGTTTYTPRLNLFRDSGVVLHSFAFFTSVVVFCFVAAFSLGNASEVTSLVPAVLFVLLMATLAMFRLVQTTAFRSIQLASVLEQTRGREVVEGMYPTLLREPVARSPFQIPANLPATHEVRWDKHAGILQVIDVPQLIQLAEQTDLWVDCCVQTGDTVFKADVIARAHGASSLGDDAERAFLETFSVGPERTFEQDPRLVLRVFGDIALRALSPAVYDPTTASQAIDAMEIALRDLMARDLDVAAVEDRAGHVRLQLALPDWSDYVALATEELINIAPTSAQVTRSLTTMLERLLALAPAARREPLERALEKLRALASPRGAGE